MGEIDESGNGYYIWTHKKFDLGRNGKQIVDVNLTSEAKVKLVPNTKISFSYEVSRRADVSPPLPPPAMTRDLLLLLIGLLARINKCFVQ